MIKLLIIINGWTTKISGGDSHIIGVSERWFKKCTVELLVPKVAYRFLPKNLILDRIYLPNTRFEDENKLKTLPNIIFAYIFRIINSSRRTFEKKYDVVISSSHFIIDVLPAIVYKRKMKSKLVVYIYHLVSSHRRRISLQRYISILDEKLSLWLIRKNADIIFTDNEIVKSELLDLGFNGDKIFITDIGINVDFIRSIPNVNNKKYDACFIGRLVTQKGIFDLVSVWSAICKGQPSAKLAIIGDGPKYSEFMTMIKNHNLESNIDLLGFISEKDKIETLKYSKIFIFPSYEEGWGIAVCEAMACGLAVVAYDLPAYKNVYKMGMLTVPIGDIKALTEKIENLLKDESMRVTMGKKAEIQANEYDINNIARDEFSIINKEFNRVI